MEEYDKNGNLLYKGEYKDEKKWNGIRKEYSENKLIFEAEVKNEEIINSKYYDKNNNILEFKNGTGYTRIYEYLNLYNPFEYLSFEGELVNGLMHGKGKEFNIFKHLEYEGDFFNGQRHGKGKEYDLLGNIKYEGEFINGKRKE